MLDLKQQCIFSFHQKVISKSTVQTDAERLLHAKWQWEHTFTEESID